MLGAVRALARKTAPGLLWSTAVFVVTSDWEIGDDLGSPRLLLDTKDLWGSKRRVHTRADPFLFGDESALYLFLEVQRTGEHGIIEAYRTEDLMQFEPLGGVLREAHHLSYPFVFESSGKRYMIPEAADAGEVALYQFEVFPVGLHRVRTLLAGHFADTSAIRIDGTWFVFTTSERGLELFTSGDLLLDDLVPHPLSPITNDPRFRRGGGALFFNGGTLLRPAQDSSERYGGNLNLLRVEEISRSTYREACAHEGLFDRRYRWNRLGGHHLSVANFRGETVVAVDGLQQDYWHNKLRRLSFGSIV